MIPSELLGVVILPKNCIMLFVSEFSCVVENKKGEKSVSKNSTSDY